MQGASLGAGLADCYGSLDCAARELTCLPERIVTHDRTIQLAPQQLVDDVARVKTWLQQSREADLVLIGRRQLRTNNSWMHNYPSLTKGPLAAAYSFR